MNTRLEQWSWPLADVGQALQALAARHRLPYEAAPPLSELPQDELTNDGIGRWITHSAESMGLEAEWVFVPYSRFKSMLANSAPAVFGFSLGGPPLFLAILGGNQKQVTLLGPDLRVGRFQVAEVIALFRWKLEVPLAGEIDGLLDEAGVSDKQRPKVRDALFHQRFRDQGCRLCWLLRVPAGKSFWHAAKQRHLPRFFAYFTVCHVLQYLLFLFAWRIVGRGGIWGTTGYRGFHVVGPVDGVPNSLRNAGQVVPGPVYHCRFRRSETTVASGSPSAAAGPHSAPGNRPTSGQGAGIRKPWKP